jgi:hypothetical protein
MAAANRPAAHRKYSLLMKFACPVSQHYSTAEARFGFRESTDWNRATPTLHLHHRSNCRRPRTPRIRHCGPCPIDTNAARDLAVCTENSNPDVMMVKPAEDRV